MGSTRTVSVVFTDMEGSTEVSSSRGDEAAMELLRVHETLARHAANGHSGTVVKSTGDGYLLAFDTCEDAIAAALEMRARLALHNDSHPSDPVRVRMGINVGQAIEESGDLYGLAVNAGARITAKASTGQVLVSDDVRARAAAFEGITFVDRGLFWLKGIREQWRLYEVTDGAPTAPPEALTDRLPFAGRDDERAALRRSIDAASEGRGGLVLVHGVAGAGKTRLVEEVVTEAEARGLHVVGGRCFEALTDAPYTPVIEAIESLERRISPADFRAALGSGAADVARLLPHLRTRYVDIESAVEWPVQEQRKALFNALVDTLARLAATRPLVLMIDDLHWADEATLRFFEHLAAQLDELPISVIATYAGDEPSATTAFRTFLTNLHRRRLADSLPVGPLDHKAIGAILTTIARHEAPRSVVELISEATGGNAFFVDELLRHLIATGALLTADGAWLPADAIAEGGVPDTVRVTIDARLERLSESTRAVLTLAAVVGRDISFELLEALVEVDEDELLDCLDEAERMHIVTAETDGELVRFSFSHGLIRRTLAATVSLTRRQRLHLRVADALEQVYADSLDDHVAAIAMHLASAGRWSPVDRRLKYLLLAADRALEAAAFDEALRHFDRALAIVPETDLSTKASVLERMGLAERSLGHLDDALALWDEALTLYDTLGDGTEVARVCLTAAVQVAWWRRGGEVTSLVDRGLHALGDLDSPLRAGLLALAGGVASQGGSYDRATRLLDEALAIARRHDDDAVLGLSLYSLAVHHFGYCHFENVVTAGRAAITHFKRAGDHWNLANVLGYVSAALGWLGRFDEAYSTGEEAEQQAVRLNNWSAYVFADGGKAFRDIGTDPAPAELAERGRRALELGQELAFPWLTTIGHTRLGLSSFWSGEWEAALAAVEEAASGEQRTASGGHLGRLFLLHAYLGNHETVVELIDSAEAELPVVGRPNSGTAWTLGLAAIEALAMVGERERAARLYPVAIDHGATGALMRSWDYRLSSTVAGVAAGCGRDWDLAEHHFTLARRQAIELPMRQEEPDALRFHSAMLLARALPGDAERATALLDEALALYERLGMNRHAQLTRQLRDDGAATVAGGSSAGRT